MTPRPQHHIPSLHLLNTNPPCPVPSDNPQPQPQSKHVLTSAKTHSTDNESPEKSLVRPSPLRLKRKMKTAKYMNFQDFEKKATVDLDMMVYCLLSVDEVEEIEIVDIGWEEHDGTQGRAIEVCPQEILSELFGAELLVLVEGGIHVYIDTDKISEMVFRSAHENSNSNVSTSIEELQQHLSPSLPPLTTP
ncbi:uncharacterized protein MYCFIDRAFT_208434 [Pseudocercospora fijiensis CIRAD86]|uniref:Uncharacterized protein n=1 Tax=Pseudocercospora fijiensis (strain CIRAD86) TaxID=383855 RepID=M3AS56_PSEFD|nr:uncharacterized protein MYCFIDRAFT_208434 [Pseudocercospora fijiensis CIRAD86]EME79973.1 hypothetical protein MYCFIDRAFT_208434 [Pseudocercospora fijiensis CIRAD86]